MCVSARGWMLALIATSFQGRAVPSGSVTARIDSLLVRTRCPSRSLIRGSEPPSLQRASSWFVPSAPAEITMPRAVNVRRRLRNQAPGRSVVDRVAVGTVRGTERTDVDDLALGMDLDAALFGEPQVVLDQRVLGADAAADHAGAAARAAGASRPLAAEVRIRHGRARLAEEDAQPGCG